MKKLFTILLLISFVFSQWEVNANGPLIVVNGKAVTYGSRPLIYRCDQGTLGSLSNSSATSLVDSLFSEWSDIQGAKIVFQKDNPDLLGTDINSANYAPILEPSSQLGYTPLIFDTDGSIIKDIIGSGAENQIIGFAGATFLFTGDPHEIAESQALFNGRFINGINNGSDIELSLNAFKKAIVHEIGHAIGLDHSQINTDALDSDAPQSIKDSTPLMFPYAVNELFSVTRDDASGASLLYPNNTELVNYGTIQGKVFRADGTTPVLGANVIARNINSPRLEAISCVSGYLDSTGSFTLFAVPPGNYRIEIEPISALFTGGSGVGPYSNSLNDLSFVNPVPKGFYTGTNQLITSDISSALILNVSGGQTIQGVNIIAKLASNKPVFVPAQDPSSPSATSTSSSSSSGLVISQNNSNIDVVLYPMLPEAISLPLIPDEFIGKIGVALIGSNPAFEIKLPDNNLFSGIVSVDLEDSNGAVFSNVLFNVTKIPDSTDKLILSLKIPDDVSKGTLKLNVNLADGTRLTGLIEIIAPLNLRNVINGKGKTIGKPQIIKTSVVKNGRNITLNITGNNFAGNKVFILNGNEKTLFQTDNSSPNTSVTIFPSNLNVSMNLLSVSGNNKILTVKFNLSENIEKSVKSVISISTPRGIVSSQFILKK